MLIKNGSIYVFKNNNYVSGKQKNFQFSMLQELKPSKNRYMVQNVLEKMSGGVTSALG